MELKDVLGTLGYDRSPNFLSVDRLNADPDNAHIYRKAQQDCGLSGAYTLRSSQFDKAQPDIPVVFVCETQSEEKATEIHRQVWNQNIVPFLLVVSPKTVRLYPGFRFSQSDSQLIDDPQSGVLRVIRSFNEVASALDAFRAESIDAG
jgi:hypothetical protein